MSINAALETENRWLIHAGTKLDGTTLRTNGGRVAAVVARASSTKSDHAVIRRNTFR